MSLPSPKELDAQARIHVDRWIDIESAECKELDDNYAFTKKCLKLGMEGEPAYLAIDTDGRIWGRGEDNIYHPFHFEHGHKLIGYRLCKKAAN
jgi:hypothetical protein